MPIVFALVWRRAGLLIGGYDLQVLSSSMGRVRKAGCCSPFPPSSSPRPDGKCGMSHALVDFARALVGWVKADSACR